MREQKYYLVFDEIERGIILRTACSRKVDAQMSAFP